MTKLDYRLFAAIKSGNRSDVDAALNEGARLDARDESGETPLHVAAGEGNIEVVKALLDRGADPNAGVSGGNPNARGRTPLHQAVFAGSGAVIALLLQRGADPFVRDVHNQTPVSCADRSPSTLPRITASRLIPRPTRRLSSIGCSRACRATSWHTDLRSSTSARFPTTTAGCR